MPEPLNAPIPREDKKKSEGKKKTVVHHCDCGNCKEYPIVMVKGKSLCEKHWGMLRSSKADRAWSVRNMLGWNKELPAVTVIEELKNDKALNKKKKKVEESWADSEDNEDIDQKVARDIEQNDDFLSRLADGEFDVED